MTECLRFGVTDELFGGTIEDADAAGGIDADDARARRGQHRLDEPAAAVDKVAGADQLVALGAQLLCHLVEGLAELREIALRPVDRHLDVQIARRNDIGCVHQPPYRSDQPVGEVQPDQNRGHQNGQCDHRKHQRERHLNPKPARFQLGIFGDAGLGLPELCDHAWIEQTGHIQERIVEGAQPDHGRDVVGFDEHRDLGLVFVNIAQEFRRRRREALLNAGLRCLQNIAILVDQHGARQIARGGTCRQQLAKRRTILVEQWPSVGDIVGHSQNVAANELRVLVQIGIGDNQRVLNHLTRRT